MDWERQRELRMVAELNAAARQDWREALQEDLLQHLRNHRELSVPQETAIVLDIPLGLSVRQIRVEPNGNCIEQSTGEWFYRLNGEFQHPT
ncbi:MAG: hypothetical protein WC497_02260 [Patescibacteria group bacterium]